MKSSNVVRGLQKVIYQILQRGEWPVELEAISSHKKSKVYPEFVRKHVVCHVIGQNEDKSVEYFEKDKVKLKDSINACDFSEPY